MSRAPAERLSVIVTVVDGGRVLERCLDAIGRQEYPPDEVIVPWDESAASVGSLAVRYPSVRFLSLGRIRTAKPPESIAGQHELFDRRRAAGLAASSGSLVAMLEDRGAPRPSWAGAMVSLHGRQEAAAIGGAIEHAGRALLNWAVYYCDFGRYQLPFAEGESQYLSDINICYRRDALERTRELWSDRYHETTVNWALGRAGQRLVRSPEPVVEQLREQLALSAVLRERVVWGRLFAYTRAREVSVVRRMMLALATPVLPFVLGWRLLRDRAARPGTLRQFVVAGPAVLLLLIAWSVGEAVGYVSGEP